MLIVDRHHNMRPQCYLAIVSAIIFRKCVSKKQAVIASPQNNDIFNIDSHNSVKGDFI